MGGTGAGGVVEGVDGARAGGTGDGVRLMLRAGRVKAGRVVR